MILVRFLDLKFLHKRAAIMIGLQIHRTKIAKIGTTVYDRIAWDFR